MRLRQFCVTGLVAATLTFAAPANARINGFPPRDGTDYGAHIIVVTGKPLARQDFCGLRMAEGVEVYQVVLIPKEGGRASIAQMGILDDQAPDDSVSPGTRFVALGEPLSCANIFDEWLILEEH